jgi:hypothetical protein
MLTACNGYTPKSSRGSLTTSDSAPGFIANKNGDALRQKDLPAQVEMDTALPQDLRTGCTNAIAKINTASGLSLLKIAGDQNPDQKQHSSILIQYGTVKNTASSEPAGAELSSLDVYITLAKITFDSQFKFSQNPDGSQYDAESACLHALGHALGLNHLTNENSVMYFNMKTSLPHQDIAPEDVSRLKLLYSK